MSTNEPPVDPTGWRPPGTSAGDTPGGEDLGHLSGDAEEAASTASDELKQPWTPPAVGETGPEAPVPPPPSMTPPPPPAAPVTPAATTPAGTPTIPPAYPPPVPPAYPPAPPAAAPGGHRKRPAVVTAAAAILLLMALCQLGQSVLGLSSMASTVNRFKDRAAVIGAAQSDIDSHVSQIRVSYVLGMIFAILFAVVLAGLAYGLLKGSNGARIATWVIAGIAIICDCCSSVFYFGANGIDITRNGDNYSMDSQLAQAQLDAFPAWYLATGGGISLLQLLGYIAVAVLLALPAANAFFKKVAPGWVPSTS
jgi:hypothetical protein